MTIQRVLRRLVYAIAAFLLLLGIGLGAIGNLSHKSYLAALLAAALIAGLCLWCRKKPPALMELPGRQNPAAVCLLLAFLCLLVNGIWVIVFHPLQAADYQTFFQAAADLADGGPLSGKDYIAMFPHILGYAAFLSVFFRLFGVSILTAAAVNVILTTLSGVILYVLCLKHCGRKAAAA